MPLEFEAKFLNVDVADCRARLAAQGYHCTRPWGLMRRHTYLLTEIQDGLGNAKWARIRDEGNKVTMTYKHSFDATRIDGTEEVEFEVNDFENAVLFMDKLGFKNRLYQENQRETWTKDQIEVTLNEWPALAPFVEVEGPDATLVEDASNTLGFDFGTAVFGGIGRVYKLTNDWDMNFVHELTFAKAGDLEAMMNERAVS